MALPRLRALVSRGHLSKWLWMAALVPLFLAAVLPSRVATLICRFTGAAMEAESCCPTGDEAPPDVQARLLDEGCCSRMITEFPTLIGERRSEMSQVRVDQPAVYVSAGAAPRAGRPAGSIRPVGPTFRPPPLALKRSLLI
jgi:hypothetical protein